MEKLVIDWDYGSNPLWRTHSGTGVRIVDEDSEVKRLVAEIRELFSSYFERNSHGQRLWLDYERARVDKGRMLELLGRLNARLDEINDGSFRVFDLETKLVETL